MRVEIDALPAVAARSIQEKVRKIARAAPHVRFVVLPRNPSNPKERCDDKKRSGGPLRL